MSATSNNPRNFSGKHYWPADHFSVPAESMCFNMAPSPDADCWCIRQKGHPGDHQYRYSPLIRDYSWKERSSMSPTLSPRDEGGRP